MNADVMDWVKLIILLLCTLLLIVLIWETSISRKVKKTTEENLKAIVEMLIVVKEWVQHGKNIRGEVKEQSNRIERKINHTEGLMQDIKKDMPEETAQKVVDKISDSAGDSGKMPTINPPTINVSSPKKE